jgi:hypothetical protein
VKTALAIIAVAAISVNAAAATDPSPARAAAPGGACSATVPCTLQLSPQEVMIVEQALMSAPVPANTSLPLVQKIDGQRLLQERQADKPAQK